MQYWSSYLECLGVKELEGRQDFPETVFGLPEYVQYTGVTLHTCHTRSIR